MSESRNNNSFTSSVISFNPSKSLSIYIRIFINYTQIIAIIYNMELKWPTYVRNYLRLSGNVSTLNTQLFSLECLIADYNLNIEVIYMKSLLNILIYVGFLTAAAWFFFFKNFLHYKKDDFRKYIILAVVISIFMQPNSIKETSDIFNCQTINKKDYLIQEMKVECYTLDHMRWVFLN